MILTKLKRTFRLRYTLRCMRALLFDGVKASDITPRTLLIVRLDVIGDYVLFRNFLEVLRASEKFAGYRITLCGNELWKDLALEFDHAFVDEFIWINKGKFTNDFRYRKKILQQLAAKGFEVAVCPNAARDFLLGDSVIRASHSAVRVGSAANKSIDSWIFSRIGSLFYTRLIDNRKPAFELDKNRVFFEQLLDEPVNVILPQFALPVKQRSNRIVVIPGAGEPARQWKEEHFVAVVRSLLENGRHHIVIAGGPTDKGLAASVIKQVAAPVEDLTGQTSLPDLVKLIAGSALVIAHDSGGLHIAAATGTPAVGLMTGKHYRRFGPYSHHPENIRLVFPRPESYYQELFRKHGPSYFEDVFSDINAISPATVIALSNALLYEHPPHR